MRLPGTTRPRPVRFLLVGLAGLLLVSCGGSAPEPEKPLRAVSGDGFSILMPGKPTRKAEALELPDGAKAELVTYLVDGKTRAYIVNHIDFPKGAKLDVSSASADLASAVKGTLTEDKATTYLGYEARDAQISNVTHPSIPGDSATAFARVILVKTRIYQLVYVERGSVSAPPANFSGFLDSLVIT